MPTGYTNSIADGISFEKFVLNCARAFGALITMRDESFDTPIPQEFKPSDYHSKAIIKIMKELKSLETMTDRQATKMARAEYEKELKYQKDGVQKALDLRKKYNDMLIKVQAWMPPSPDHTELKSFMIEQIRSSIKFDCGTSYYERQKLQCLSGQEWKANRNQKLLKDLAYHTKEDNKEHELVAGRNLWVKQLRESLSTE